MATFPTLKTGAVVQYPTTTKLNFSGTTVVDFLDGSSHRYTKGPALRQWVIRLEQLDAVESGTLYAFLRNHAASTFSFTDPVTGNTAARCVLRGLELKTTIEGERNEHTSFVIEELP